MANRYTKPKFTKAESVILLSTTSVERLEIRNELLTQIKKLKSQNLISNSPKTRCLLVSGSHGDPQGASVLSSKDRHDEELYREDCAGVGILPAVSLEKEELPLDVADIPDILEVTKLSRPRSGSYYADPEVNQMTFQVLNAAFYYGNIDRLVQDIATFNPDVIMIGWCYSQFGDLSLTLRRSAQFSKMIITHDLRVVTGKPTAKLDEIQERLLMDIVNSPVRTNVLVWGGPGSGKTNMEVEGAKVKLSKLIGTTRKMISIFVTSDHSCLKPLLLEKIEKAFNDSSIEVTCRPLDNYCESKKISTEDPVEKINQVTARLSEDHPDRIIIFIADEVDPDNENAPTDWSLLEVRKNVIWLIALRPMGFGRGVIIPGDSENVLSRQLLYKHRMSPAISKFFKCVIDHYHQGRFLDMSQDILVPDESLPDGPLPIWIEIPNTRITQLEILRQVSKLKEIQGSSVTVMYNMELDLDCDTADPDAAEFCKERNWKYVDSNSMYGREDEAIIVLDPAPPTTSHIMPEYISRATSKLIMMMTVDNDYEEKYEAFRLLTVHKFPNFRNCCPFIENCPYYEIEILDKRRFDNVNEKCLRPIYR